MGKIKYLIIGGGVAGTTAAETIRQNDPTGSCMIVSDEPYRLYSRIMLSKPNFFLEKIPFDRIWLKTEEWYTQNNITLTTGKKATKLDPQKKTITLDDGTEVAYEKLLLATGTCVRPWSIPGSDKEGVFYLRTLDHAKQIIAKVKSAKRAVVVGGGFIGFEMCDMLRLAHIETALLLRKERFWSSLLDKRSTDIIETALERGGVTILRNTEVREVKGDKATAGVILTDGTELPCDMIIVSIGAGDTLAWIRDTGVKTDRGIITNEYLATNLPDVWAAGDAAEFTDVIHGEQAQLSNWANAQEQGKIAAHNMCGKREQFRFVSSYVAQGFGITISFAGNVRVADDRSIVGRGVTDGPSWSRIILKNGKIVGATIINNIKEVVAITKLIEKGDDMKQNEQKLADPLYNLTSLL